MKEITAFLNSKGYLFKQFKRIEPKHINSRKKIDIYSGCDIKNHFISIFIINQKSRVLIKNAKEIIELKDRLVLFEDHNFKKNILLIKSPICDKAIDFFKENRWALYDDFV